MLSIDTTHHSPNQVPRTRPVQLIVLHATVGSYASALAWLTNPVSGVSTHYLIAKDGHIAQLVPDDAIAWHAGVSRWGRFVNVNDIAIGIELENKNDGRDPYPAPQLDALTALTRDLLARHGIAASAIVLHKDIAQPPGRKTDPAGFSLAAFVARLTAPAAYRLRGLPVYQRADRTGPIAGYVSPGEQVTIDNPANGHLASGLGFVDLHGLEPV